MSTLRTRPHMTAAMLHPPEVNPYEAPLTVPDPLLVPADIAVGNEGWTVHYELTADDLVAWSMYANGHSHTAQRSVRGLHIVGFIAASVPLIWITVLLKLVSLQPLAAGLLGLAVVTTLLGSWFGFLFT